VRTGVLVAEAEAGRPHPAVRDPALGQRDARAAAWRLGEKATRL
jgi:hypothetical protein